MPRTFNWTYESATALLEYAEQIGDVLHILSRSKRHVHLPLSVALHSIKRPFDLHQFKMYRAKNGTAQAVITWAWLSPFTMDYSPVRSLVELHPSEWNEGECLCICDMASTIDNTGEIISDFMASIARDEEDIIVFPSWKNLMPNEFTRWKRQNSHELVSWLEGQ